MFSKPGKRVTIAEIAQEAGVSVATVSRVVNKVDHPIDPDTRKRVEEVIKRKNYTSNVFGKGLAGQTNIIGVSTSVPLSMDPGAAHNIARIFDGIKSVTRSRGYHVILEIDDASEDPGLHVFAGIPLAGVLHIAPRENDRIVEILRQGSVPFVLIGSSVYSDCNYVDADNDIAGRLAVQHLAQIGRKKIAFIGGSENNTPRLDSLVMLRGFQDELKRQHLPLNPRWISSVPMKIEGGRDAALAMFALKDRPDSIFAFTDFLAVGALQAARELGYEVPADISIMGYDDFPFASAVTPLLTTFRHPDQEIAAMATKALLDRLSSKKNDGFIIQELVEPRLIIRDSTNPIIR